MKPNVFNPEELCNKNCNEGIIRARQLDRAAKRKLQARAFLMQTSHWPPDHNPDAGSHKAGVGLRWD